MRKQTCIWLILALFVVFTTLAEAKKDNDNMRWKLSWASEATSSGSGPEVEEDILAPYRGHPIEAWFDIDGDGNLELIYTDNNYETTYIYENAGDNKYEYRWFFNLWNADGASLIGANDGRLSGAVDMDNDGADEFYNITDTGPVTDPNHMAAMKIWRHEPGSAEFLPPADEWTVQYDGIPSGRDEGTVVLEYYGGCGDWDNDGKGEIALNYKQDPVYYFGILEVGGPITQDDATFNIELEILKKDYMKDPSDLNVARTWGKDVDNDGYAELLLMNRNNLTQCVHYLDCKGEDTWDVYEWGAEQARVIPDSGRVSERYDWADVNGDGVYETLYAMGQGYGLAEGYQSHISLWAAKVNPMDPANLLKHDDWMRLKTVDEMLGFPIDTLVYTTGVGYLGVGDADKDNLPDVYFSLGESSGSYLMDAEFVGDNVLEPGDYNYYKIVHCPVAAGLADTTTAIQGANGQYGDGDKDGKADIVHNNRRDGVDRPAIYIWEYDAGTGVDIDFGANTAPASFVLNQNYPNPFNPSTTISYTLDKAAHVSLKVYNINGELVASLVDGKQVSGLHQVTWDGTNTYGSRVASGVYFCAMNVGAQKSVKKMTLMK
jgi:hypothetical protein